MDSDGTAVISEETEQEQAEVDEKQESQDDERPALRIESREDARAILSWQYERYQHLQSLSRGLFGTLIAMLAILVSVTVTFSDQLRSIPTEMGPAFRTAASSTPVGPDGAFLTVVLNGLILYTMVVLSMYSFGVATLRLYEVFTERKLSTNIVLGEIANLEGSTVDEELLEFLRSNHDKLDETYAKFTEGAFRILLFSSLVIGMAFIYYYAARIQLTNLLIHNIMLMIPGSIITKFGLKIVRSEDDQANTDDEGSMTFAEEFFHDDKGRWSHIEFHRIENLLVFITTIISFFIVLIWVLSILF